MACLRAVFFDAFGTLLDVRGLHLEATRLILMELGLAGRIGAEELHERWDEYLLAFWREGRYSKTLEALRASLEKALGDFGASISPGELNRAEALLLDTYSKARLYEGAKEILVFCRSLGLRTGLISDSDAPLLRSLLGKHGLVSLFDTIVISDEVGSFKPARRPFEIALRNAGCEAGEAMMVGDAGRDIEGAKKVGMLVAIVLHPQRKPPELIAQSDIVVNALAELKGPIAALSRQYHRP